MSVLLRVLSLTKRFGATPVVQDVGFEVARGEIFALLGPSGCGKTTTLRCVAGFERADAGEIQLCDCVLEAPGRYMPPEARGIGVVFQDYALFPHLNVLENVLFGLRHLARREREAQARETLRKVGLAGYETRRPHQLSGGQQQRVALARTLAPAPTLVLLDEPFSGLDALLRQEMRHEVRELLKSSGMTALMVTHDQEEALSFADRVAVMRAGRIEQVGTPEAVYYRPRTLFVAQFLGRTNLLLSQAHGTEADTPLGPIPMDRAAAGPVLLSLRPEMLGIEASGAGGLEGHVVGREFRGHDITFRVRSGEAEYLAHTDNRVLFGVGDAVSLRPLAPAVVLESQGLGERKG